MSWAPNRRHFLASVGLATAASGLPPAWAKTTANLVVVGGGFGGATCASYLKRLLPQTNVTLIEPNTSYYACPFSNLVISGNRQLSEQEFGYSGIKEQGVEVVHQAANDVDSLAKTITLSDTSKLSYDKLVLSPGISFRWSALAGYDEAAANTFPHAWKAGEQTALLARKLHDLEDGRTVVISVPPAPFRCPPGPYERASLIAHFLKHQKPKSKLIILDANETFSKMPLFQEAWAEHYPEHLEWRSASNDGRVTRVDAGSGEIFTDFETISAGVVNIIPPQQANIIAQTAGVTNATGWCPINATNFESAQSKDIHVIGDASIASPMPKSAFSANLQGKICAIAIADALSGSSATDTILANTCYSFTTPEEAISIVGVYHNQVGKFTSVEGAGGLSPLAADKTIRNSEASQAADWFRQITTETFGL